MFLVVVVTVLVIVVLVVGTVMLTRQQSETETENSYGVERATDEDPGFRKIWKLCFWAMIFCMIVAEVGTLLYYYGHAKKMYDLWTCEEMKEYVDRSVREYSDEEYREYAYIEGIWSSLSTDGERFQNLYDRLTVRQFMFGNPCKFDSTDNAKLEGDYNMALRNVWHEVLIDYEYETNQEDLYYSDAENMDWLTVDPQELFNYPVPIAAEKVSGDFAMGVIPVLLGLLFGILLYPVKIARRFSHAYTTEIAWVCLVTGAMIAPWIAMLIWAASAEKKRAPSAPEELFRWNDLLAKGIISEEEFEAKKRELLSR